MQLDLKYLSCLFLDELDIQLDFLWSFIINVYSGGLSLLNDLLYTDLAPPLRELQWNDLTLPIFTTYDLCWNNNLPQVNKRMLSIDPTSVQKLSIPSNWLSKAYLISIQVFKGNWKHFFYILNPSDGQM